MSEVILIDVSAAQGKINHLLLAASGRVVGEIIKVTEGNSGPPDAQFAANWTGAGIVGLRHGAYHYAHPDTVHINDPEEEADHFVRTLVDACPGDTPSERARYLTATRIKLALDIEEARQIHAGPVFVEWVLRFCERVEATSGLDCMIYCGGPFWSEHAGPMDLATEARVRAFDLWIAAYVTDPARFVAMTPWRTVGHKLHQRSGNTLPGATPAQHYSGIVGEVDTDVFHGTRADYDAWREPKHEPAPTLDGAGAPLGWADRAEQEADTDPAPPLVALLSNDPDEPVTDPATPTSKSQDRMRAVRTENDPKESA